MIIDAGKDPEEAGPDLQRGDDSALGARPIYSSEERPRPMDSRGREIAADGIRRVIRRPDVEDRWEGGGGGEGRDRPVHRGAGLPGPPGGERDEGFGNGIRWGAEGAGREGHINRLVPGGGAPFQRRRFSRSPAARSTSPRCRRGPSSSPRGRKRSVSRSASPRNRLSLPSRDAGRRFTGGRWRRRHSRSLSRSRSFSRSRSRGRYRGGGRSRSPADKRTKEEAAAALAKAAAAANLASLSQQTTLQPLNMMNMQITRHARRAYVGCLPLGATEVRTTCLSPGRVPCLPMLSSFHQMYNCTGLLLIDLMTCPPRTTFFPTGHRDAVLQQHHDGRQRLLPARDAGDLCLPESRKEICLCGVQV